MAAHYDTYDYPAYWQGRDYEHRSEEIAIKKLLLKVPKVETTLEIGAGFGRLAPLYLYRSKKIILSDPSSKLLSIARNKYKNLKKIKTIHSGIENLPNKVKKGSIDLVVMVRVLHHIEDIENAFETVNKVLSPGGYFILEFANKRHLKAVLKEFSHGNFTFPLDIFPKDIRSKKAIKQKTLPFINYHPDVINNMLSNNGFNLIDKLSVSNLRHSMLKNILSLDTIVSLENKMQKPLSYWNFGPSIFVLARKKENI